MLAARGRGGGHKGGRKQYTNPDELNARTEREEREKAWRRNRGELEESESGSGDESGSEDGSEESDGDDGKEAKAAKGAEALIEVQNPNRVVKVNKKVGEVAEGSASSSTGEVQLSRREREEIEKQRARENYMRLHAEGKTEQARADLARLALIRREREEAAKKREQERHEKDGASKTAAVNKVAAVRSAVTGVTVSADAPAPGLKKKTGRK